MKHQACTSSVCRKSTGRQVRIQFGASLLSGSQRCVSFSVLEGIDQSFMHANATQTGLSAMKYDSSQQSLTLSATPANKRKLGETEFDGPGSDDEEYGWQGDDDGAMPAPPPQWQGSEDILIGQRRDSGDEVGDSDADLDDDDEDELLAIPKGSP